MRLTAATRAVPAVGDRLAVDHLPAGRARHLAADAVREEYHGHCSGRPSGPPSALAACPPPTGGTTFCYTAPPAPSRWRRPRPPRCVGYLRAEAGALSGVRWNGSGGDYLNTLLIGSGVALAAMTVIALGLGWLVSGRVLSPPRTITRTARNISASNLHRAARACRARRRAQGAGRHSGRAAGPAGRLVRRTAAVRRECLPRAPHSARPAADAWWKWRWPIRTRTVESLRRRLPHGSSRRASSRNG